MEAHGPTGRRSQPREELRDVEPGRLRGQCQGALPGRLASPAGFGAVLATIPIVGRQELENRTPIRLSRGSRPLVYQGAGHFLHWEVSQRFASDLVTFVDALSERINTVL